MSFAFSYAMSCTVCTRSPLALMQVFARLTCSRDITQRNSRGPRHWLPISSLIKVHPVAKGAYQYPSPPRPYFASQATNHFIKYAGHVTSVVMDTLSAKTPYHTYTQSADNLQPPRAEPNRSPPRRNFGNATKTHTTICLPLLNYHATDPAKSPFRQNSLSLACSCLQPG